MGDVTLPLDRRARRRKLPIMQTLALAAIAVVLLAPPAQAQAWEETDCAAVRDYIELRRDLGLRATDAAAAQLLRDRTLLLRTLRDVNPEALERLAPSLGDGIDAFELAPEAREVIRRLEALVQRRCGAEVP